jgi:hypothetical protein
MNDLNLEMFYDDDELLKQTKFVSFDFENDDDENNIDDNDYYFN